jgi:hypothetical protein
MPAMQTAWPPAMAWVLHAQFDRINQNVLAADPAPPLYLVPSHVRPSAFFHLQIPSLRHRGDTDRCRMAEDTDLRGRRGTIG